MVDIKNLKVGLAPSQKFPATIREKRGFRFYAKQKKIAFEIANPNKEYDLIFVSSGADLSVWSQYQKNGTKIVYELVDSYFAIPEYSIKNLLRGLAKYLTGQHKYLLFSQRKTYEAMCKRADAIICCTREQKKYLQTLCPNTHIILDSKHMFKRVKNSYDIKKEVNIVWEGLPYNIKSFSVIKNVLSDLNKRYKVNLHMITSLEYGKYMGEYIKKQTINDVRKMFDINAIYLYEWNIHTCSQIAGACDLAVIPMNKDDPMDWGKPENKLLNFWLMGLPTLTSATPAHLRVMAKADLPMTCSSEKNWIELLEYYIKNSDERELAANKGFAFASATNNAQVIVSQYDDVMNSVIQ
jgi:hypothetical protein